MIKKLIPILFLIGWIFPLHAEEPSAPVQSPVVSPSSPPAEKPLGVEDSADIRDAFQGDQEAEEAPAPKKKVRVRREKEAEGTRAQSSPRVDTVIKSQYRSRGRPLDVDPN